MNENEKDILIYEAYKTMTDEELRQISQNINIELTRRDRIAKQKAWQAVRNAVYDYVTVYGAINITDGYEDIEITAHADYGTIGKINDALSDN